MIKDLVLIASLALGGCSISPENPEPIIENPYKNLYYPHGPKVQPRNIKGLNTRNQPRYDMQLGCYIDDEGKPIELKFR